MKRGTWASLTTVISSFVCWPCTMPVSRHSCEDPQISSVTNIINKKLIITCCIITILYVGCSLIPHHTEFDDKAVLEDAMEMSLPYYRITGHESDPIIDCHGDFFNKIHIEFDNIPS